MVCYVNVAQIKGKKLTPHIVQYFTDPSRWLQDLKNRAPQQVGFSENIICTQKIKGGSNFWPRSRQIPRPTQGRSNWVSKPKKSQVFETIYFGPIFFQKRWFSKISEDFERKHLKQFNPILFLSSGWWWVNWICSCDAIAAKRRLCHSTTGNEIFLFFAKFDFYNFDFHFASTEAF